MGEFSRLRKPKEHRLLLVRQDQATHQGYLTSYVLHIHWRTHLDFQGGRLVRLIAKNSRKNASTED